MDTVYPMETHYYANMMLEYMPVGVALFEVETLRLLAANPHFQTFLSPGWQQGRAIGHPVADWIPEEQVSSITSIFHGVAETGTPYRGEEYPLHNEHSVTYWNWMLDPIRDNDGHLTHLLLTISNVTPQVLARQQAEKEHALQKSIEQEKNEFLSIASHELRTPITAIQGFAEILQMYLSHGDSLDSTRSLRAISGIIEYSQRLTRLIEEMLDISRIEKAQLLVNLVPCDLLAILTHVIESQSITAKNHQLRFVMEGIEVTDGLIGCFDEDRVMQIFHNLLSNAIKYSPAGSEIEVGLRYAQDRPDEVLTWVKDQGIGIPAKEIPLIFKRFHRINTSNRFIKGLGIGLYLVQELVARHGGRVWVESAEGIGSTFYVTLPLKTYY